MNEELLKLYQQEQFEYYNQQGYSFYKVNEPTIVGTTILCLTEKETEQLHQIFDNNTQKTHLSFGYQDSKSITLIDSASSYCDLSDKSIHFTPYARFALNSQQNDYVYFPFYLHFLQQHPEWQKELIENYLDFNNIGWADDQKLSVFIDQYATSFFDVKNFLDIYPSFVLDHDFTIDGFIRLLEKKKASKGEIDDLLFSYLKSYSEEMNHPKYIDSFKTSLLSRFTQEELQPYCQFFKALEHYFNPPKANIFFTQHQFSILSTVNHSSTQESLMINNYDLTKYRFALLYFTEAFSQFYQLDFHKIDDLHIQKDEIQMVVILHNNSEMTKDFFEQRLQQFYEYLAANPTWDFSAENVISSWLFHTSLDEKLENPSTLQQKPKI